MEKVWYAGLRDAHNKKAEARRLQQELSFMYAPPPGMMTKHEKEEFTPQLYVCKWWQSERTGDQTAQPTCGFGGTLIKKDKMKKNRKDRRAQKKEAKRDSNRGKKAMKAAK